MNYDTFFSQDINRKLFYSDYSGKKMIVGVISLKNAISRLKMQEYYILVTYVEGEKLPDEYIPLNQITSDDGVLYATISPKIQLSSICRNGGIQLISRLPDLDSGSPNYLLGPGPETISQEELVMDQYNKLKNNQETKTM